MSKKPTALPTVELEDLEQVAGGRRRATSSSANSVDQQLLNSLNDIENALNNLANNGNRGNQDMMSTMLMMSLLTQPQQQPVQQPPTIICNKRGRCW